MHCEVYSPRVAGSVVERIWFSPPVLRENSGYAFDAVINN